MIKLDKWVPYELTTNQNNHSFCCLNLHNSEPFLNETERCDKKWIVHHNQWRPTQWWNQEEAPKHFLKPNLYQKMVMVTIWWSAAYLIHFSFLNLGETITSEKYAQQSMRCTEHYKICNRHWSTERAQFLSMTMPECASHNQHEVGFSKDKWIELGSFASSTIFTWPLADSSILTTLQEKPFHNQQEAENAFQEFTESQRMHFYTTRINKLISCWQKCVDCSGTYFD